MQIIVSILLWCFFFFSGCSKKKPRVLAVDILPRCAMQDSGNLGTSIRKPRILVFTSNGGGGHISAVKALHEYLDADYEVIAVNLIQDVLFSLDPFQNYIGRGWNGEELYNWLLRRGAPFFVNTLCSVGKWHICRRGQAIEELTSQAIDFYKPDVVLSVMPIFNGALSRLAEVKKLPFLVLTVDLDTVNYLNNLTNASYPGFHFCVAAPEKMIMHVPKYAHIPQESIHVTGFPLRTSFLRMYDRVELKKLWNIPENKPIIMLSMGAVGSKITYEYARKLCRLDFPVHIIVCLGRNQALARRLSTLKWQPWVTTTFVGFTDKMAELMAMSDILLTKAGPTTICEAIAMKLPMLIDYTRKGLFWERMNIDFVLSHGFGSEIRSLRDIPSLVKSYLYTEQRARLACEKLCSYAMADCSTSLKLLLQEVLKQPIDRAL